MILNIVYSPDEAHKSTQLMHGMISSVFRENGLPVFDFFMVEGQLSSTFDVQFPVITTSKIAKKKGIWKYVPSGLTSKLCGLVDSHKARFVVCDGLGVARQMFPVLKKNPELKLVVVVHAVARFKQKDLKNFIRYSDRVKLVLVSSSLANEIYNCYPVLRKQSSIIPNTLSSGFVNNLLPKSEARELLGLPSQSKLYVVASRLSVKKDVATVVRAYARLPAENSYLVIMGEGPCRSDLECLVIDLGIKDRVIWLGWVKNSSLYLKAFDVFVSASKTEGFGLSVFEARAAGLAVVCTDIVPHKEVLEEEGIYFNVGDAVGCANELLKVSSLANSWDLAVKYQQFSTAYLKIINE